MNSTSPYLPRSTGDKYAALIKKTVAYRVWKKKIRHFGKFNEKSEFKLLEIGCGRGYFLRCIETWFPYAEIYGIDIEKTLLDFAAQQSRRAKLMEYEGQRIPFSENTFDIISSFQVVEHLTSPEIFIQEASRTLKPRGLLLLSTPNPSGIAAKVLGRKWQGYRPDHISLKPPLQWKKLIQKYGFHIISDGTTGLTGIKILQIFPFALINWVPMAIFGYFPWYKGESYMVIAKKM